DTESCRATFHHHNNRSVKLLLLLTCHTNTTEEINTSAGELLQHGLRGGGLHSRNTFILLLHRLGKHSKTETQVQREPQTLILQIEYRSRFKDG
ncbi:hypothetical protein AMELA_G00283920, partial [Ameiurus melas]